MNTILKIGARAMACAAVVASVAAPAATATTTTAPTATSVLAPAVVSAISQANALGTPTTPTDLSTDASAVQPAVQAAIAGGSQDVEALTAQDSPVISEALLQDATVTNVAGRTTVQGDQDVSYRITKTIRHGRVVSVRRSVTRTEVSTGGAVFADYAPVSNTCWGGVYDKQSGGVVGITLYWREVEIDTWCGDGTSVTSVGGPLYSSYTAGPYCWANVEHNQAYEAGPAGPDVYYYAQNYAQIGVSTSGCFGTYTYSPWVKVKGNGWAGWGD